MCVAMSCSFFGALRRCKGMNRRGQTQAEEIVTSNVILFSYNSLRSATDNFHPSNRIGRGGFGVVYKGVLTDGMHVAIKSLSAESKQGITEFLTELTMISNIRHPNLVELVGCCIEGTHRILVYEYLENNSLESALLGSKSKHDLLDWPMRAAICMGTASGLAFLHDEAEPHIVHRDIKASNILLDANFHPKIGDFGLAKLFPDNVTLVSTRVAGTVGYLAPEYALLGQLTKKADIYSLGVLILEIISGRSSSKAAFGEDLLVLVEWTWKLKEEGRLLDIVDPELTEYSEGEVIRFIKVALFCTQAASHQRPNIKQVAEMLSKEVNLNEKALTEPGVEFDENYIQRISEPFYEDEVVNLPSAPDVSNYLISDVYEDGRFLNGNTNAPITEGMAGAEVERRLNQSDESNLMVSAAHSMENISDFSTDISLPLVTSVPSVMGPASFRTLMRSQQPSLLGAPVRLDGMKHGQDLKNQSSGGPPILARLPTQAPLPLIQPLGGWLVKEDVSRGNLNNRISGFAQESDTVKLDKQRANQNPFSHSSSSAMVSGLLSNPSQVNGEEATVGHEWKRQYLPAISKPSAT